MKKHRLGSIIISFPDSYSLEDAKDSVVARNPDGAEVQFSAIALLKAGVPVPGSGRSYVEDRGAKEGRLVTRGAKVSWFSQPDGAGDGKLGSLWYAGIDTHVVIASTTIPAAQSQIEETLNRDLREIVSRLEKAGENA